jgi:hypothetical protein
MHLSATARSNTIQGDKVLLQLRNWQTDRVHPHISKQMKVLKNLKIRKSQGNIT